jgi:glycosyltransferase involved in cell wall biosynthesis
VRILYLSQYFPPEMGAPAARVHELSREWAALGHDVTVLTGFPQHPTGVIPPQYRGQFVRREEVDGIRVVRAPIYATANRGRVRRSLSYLSYALSASLVGPWLARRPEVLIATSPQLLTAAAGALLSALYRVPFIFEVRDLWPQSIVEVGALPAKSAAVKGLEILERALYGQADRIVAVTDAFVDALAQRGVPREKVRVVKNGVDLTLFQARPRDETLRAELGVGPGDFLSLYVGTHGMAHGLGTILEAAKKLRDDPRFRFVLVGEGADKPALVEQARRERLTSVSFRDKQPRGSIAALLAACDASLVLLKDKPLFRTVLPSKIFEIMASARPIVLGVGGEARALVVDQAQAGVFVQPEDAGAVVQALRTLANSPAGREEMGRRGRAFVEAHFSRHALAQQYLHVLQEVAAA